jgi:hypothetical protein
MFGFEKRYDLMVSNTMKCYLYSSMIFAPCHMKQGRSLVDRTLTEFS